MTGNVGIGITNPGAPLHVRGQGWNIKMSDSGITSNWAILTNTGGVKYLRFYDVDNSADRVVIDGSGNVGIGTNPAHKLEVNGATQTNSVFASSYVTGGNFGPSSGWSTMRISGTSCGEACVSAGRTEFWDRISISGSHSFGAFPDPGSSGLYVVGTIYYGALSQISDIRMKTNIMPIENSLEKVNQISGVYYTWKDIDMSQERQVGVIAQDMEKVFPELVEEKDGYKYVHYDKLGPVLVEAVKELEERNSELSQKLDAQQQQINYLKKQVDELKNNK